MLLFLHLINILLLLLVIIGLVKILLLFLLLPLIKKNISASNASLHQDDAHLISSLDYKIPAFSTALDQNIPTLIFNYDQSNNIPIVEKEIQAHNNVINIHSLIPTKAYLVGDIPYKDLMHR